MSGKRPGETHLTPAEARAIARATLAEQRPGTAFGLGCLKNTDKAQRAQVFCAASPDTRLVVKVYAPASAEKARAQVARQRSVVAAWPEGAPEVLFFDEARLVLGMAYADGPSLAAVVANRAPEDAARHLEAAGHWLVAFHGLTREAHPFRPKGHIAWLHRLLEQHDSGERAIPEVAAFRYEVTRLEAMARDVRGTPSQRAVTHRDLHLANLITTREGLVGLDFENDKPDAPLRDLVALLIDAVALSDDSEALDRHAAALSQGYGPAGSAPETVVFQQRLFALGVWANTPLEPSRRQAARYLGARQVIASEHALFAG
ncbi:phosphotransferase family protein [Salipiger bermudensis]|uniref:phosphotransferase family protein n=1 Tax=Salipiger bermudensis TaxID=344736 RepID=UPI001CD64B8D|nr:aminoglycoside phosphotransferase family protein [Salipiger bermudensis]MCA0964420.1 aminoglycoside phosphotransferase family protein [Salipiger bermudensis]